MVGAILVLAVIGWTAALNTVVTDTARGHNGLPDDLSSYRWVGTVSIGWTHKTYGEAGSQVGVEESGELRFDDIESRSGSADGDYRANSLAAPAPWSKKEWDNRCGSYRLVSTWGLNYVGRYLAVPMSDFQLRSEPGGFFFGPDTTYLLTNPTHQRVACDGKSETLAETNATLAPVPLATVPAVRLKEDLDPDPYHLVGSSAWGLQESPWVLSSEVTSFGFAVHYDLRLVRTSPPENCNDPGAFKRIYTTASGVSSLRLLTAPDPDFATFDLGVRWCVLPSGQPLIQQVNPTARLSENWVFLGVLENFGLEPYQTLGKATIEGTTATGEAEYGVGASAAEFLASFVPTSRLVKGLAKATRRFKVDKRVLGKAAAAKRLRRTVAKKLDDWEDAFERRLAKAFDRIPGVPSKEAKKLADRVTDEMERTGSRLEGDLDQAPAEKLFKRLFKQVRVPLWKVRALISVHADGSYSFADKSRPLVLKDEWKHSSTG